MTILRTGTPEVNYKELLEGILEGTYETKYGEREFDSSFGTYEDVEFLVAEGWDEVNAIEAQAGKSLDEMLGDDWGFSDEYGRCSNCGKILRTSPDSYSWKPEYTDVDGERTCMECLDIPSYLESIENNPDTANQVASEAQILEAGYVKLGDFENGMYETHDNPANIFTRFSYSYESIIFTITQQEQFTMFFSAYGKGLKDTEDTEYPDDEQQAPE